MAVLVDLPPELLEQVFHGLGSVDDVHHLGRACRKTHDIILRQNIYVEIMRSIIEQSPQHRYDLQLCKMLDLHRNIVEHMQSNGSQLPATQMSPVGYTLNDWESDLALASTPTRCDMRCCLECLPEETIYDILARYQGMRVLEHLWLKRQLKESDYVSVDDTAGINELEHAYEVLINRDEQFRDGEIPARSVKTPETQDYQTLNADQRARFYSAITNVWLMNEIRWAMTNFIYPTRFNVQILLLESCKDYIKSQREVPGVDELDQYSVFKFLYHHLLPLYGTFLADRDSSKLPFTFAAAGFSKDTTHCARLLQLFLIAGQTYLQPPDLIDLAVRSTTSRKPPYPLVTLPTTTERWQRPSRAFAFPRNVGLCDDGHKRILLRDSLTHLNLIARSSFHQTPSEIASPVSAPLPDQMFTFRDDANHYFLDRALVAFEQYENHASELRDIRAVFPRVQGRMLWSIWWWANSEEKARAKMERWRQPPPSTRERKGLL